jgi:ubiquinone/menaquinone biosynthesis C-methylase UbiE
VPDQLKRLKPINDLSYTYRRHYIDEFFFHHIPEIPQDSRVLDLGGHKKKKRGNFNIDDYNFRVVYANLSVNKEANVVNDAAYLPFCNDSFNAVICAELLEHIFNPRIVLSEIFRVLPKDGLLLMTVPFLYRIHADPYDFGRYTDIFWLTLMKEVGFNEIRIEKQGFYFSVLSDFIKQYIVEHPSAPIIGRIYHEAIKLIIYRLMKLEQKPSMQENRFVQSFTTGFGIVTRK